MLHDVFDDAVSLYLHRCKAPEHYNHMANQVGYVYNE